MEIILTGGGDSDYFKQIDRHFKKLMPKKSNILLIPVATNRRNHQYCLRRIQQTFSQLEFNKISVCSDLKDLKWEHVELFHSIYIDGGNTFKLMHEIRNSKFKNIIYKFINSGGIINADSAGAIVLGKNIRTASIGKIADKNSIKLDNFRGLNLLNNYNIHCHFDYKNENDQLKNFSKKYGNTLALTEKTACYIKDNKLLVIGRAPIHLYKNGVEKTYNPKQILTL
jgi:dipeptidase E